MGSNKIKNRVGIRYKYLIVKEFAGQDWDGRSLWKCKCDCGNELIVRGDNLQSGNTKSCGCFNRKVASVRQTGKNNNNYENKSGQTGESHPYYINGEHCGKNTKAIRKLKEKIRERDKVCQECGKTQEQNGKKLDVHHIDCNDTNNIEENMITLCCNCHRKKKGIK